MAVDQPKVTVNTPAHPSPPTAVQPPFTHHQVETTAAALGECWCDEALIFDAFAVVASQQPMAIKAASIMAATDPHWGVVIYLAPAASEHDLPCLWAGYQSPELDCLVL